MNLALALFDVIERKRIKIILKMNRIEYNLTKKEETILTEKFESVMLLRQRQVNEILQKKNKNKYLYIIYLYY